MSKHKAFQVAMKFNQGFSKWVQRTREQNDRAMSARDMNRFLALASFF